MEKRKLFSYLALGLFALPLAACGGDNEQVTVLRVLNMEDYIYLNDPDSGYDEPDLVNQFEQYIADDEELSAKYGKVKVVYDTTDTPETLYSEMQTGKSLYDIMCPSDYMIQKLIASNMLVPFDHDLIPNYYGVKNETTGEYEGSKASQAIKGTLDAITSKNLKTQEVCKLEDYAVGYMWGTLGILFNPGYSKYEDRGIEFDQVIEDASKWSILMDQENIYNDYKGTISIKDSMRDTFAAGTMLAYENDIDFVINNENRHLDGLEKLRQLYNNEEIDGEEYNAKLSEIFNFILYEDNDKHAQNVVNTVEGQLNRLKKNIFGLEVDSGKQDIVTGKIGINLAWSGDAVYSMDQGEDPEQVGDNIQELYYSVPETGSNIWFDAWCMPNLKEGQRSDLQYELAHEFLNYLCEPEIVYKNMDYTGYTSFMGGDDILELVRDWYDMRTDEIYYESGDGEYYQVYAVDNSLSTEEIVPENFDTEDYADSIVALDYPDFLQDDHDSSMDSWELYYAVVDEEETIIEVSQVMLLDENDEETDVVKTYGDLTIVDTDDEIEAIDLSYVFDETLEDYEDEDMIFYSDSYSAFKQDGKTTVGRQFFCQYPDQETMTRCAVMRDYGRHNEVVMKMWEEFKSNSLPDFAIVIFVIEIAAIVFGITYFLVNKGLRNKLYKQRKAAEK